MSVSKWCGLLLCFVAHFACAGDLASARDWRGIVRATPYWESQGVAANLRTIRHWVLRSTSYCEQSDRHVLFDRRMRFLGYLINDSDPEKTQQALNGLRQRMKGQGRVSVWAPGSDNEIGYPFALGCDQPHANLDEAIARMIGMRSSDRVWGTWDGLRIASESQAVSLAEMIERVYRHRREQGVLSFPEHLLRYLLGQVLIESGGLKQSRSRANAQGLMQLMPGVLRDCGIGREHALHRMAQVDCALRLYEQNHRILSPLFEQRFGSLPAQKRRELYGYLLVQAYHGGVGRVRELLVDPELGKAASHFADNPKRYRAADMALGIVFHNMGRKDLGFASLYYLTDVGIAAEALCEQSQLKQEKWCKP